MNPEWWVDHVRIYAGVLWGHGHGLYKPSMKEELTRGEAHPRHAEQGGGARADVGQATAKAEGQGTPQSTPTDRLQQSDELRQASGEQTDEKTLDMENRKDDHV